MSEATAGGQYRDFARQASGQSVCFEQWALAVSTDREVLDWIEVLPEPKQQPNLVFAAARWNGVVAPGPYADLREALISDSGAIKNTITTRSTQTNEVGRLATLMPAMTTVAAGRPVALLEVGASAGLCLYPDRYDYDWKQAGQLTGSGGPTLSCDVVGAMPLPTAPLQVAWRGGIDLNPLDVTDDGAMRWLTTLVWPEQEHRRRRLQAAIAVARRDPPNLVAGDLLEELPGQLEQAAEYGLVVVFHSAVVAYLDLDGRAAFAEMMRELVSAGRCHWISNEGPRVLPDVTRTAPPARDDTPTFVLGIDGQAVARTHGHGTSMTWLRE